MSTSHYPASYALFRQTLKECRELYLTSSTQCLQQCPHLVDPPGAKFVQLMDDLHRGLVIKVYFAVCEADREWLEGERRLAEELFDHIWGQRLSGEALRTAARKTAEESTKLQWYSLIRPFDRISLLRERISTLETLVMRRANVVARADGVLHQREMAVIKSIQEELRENLHAIPLDEPIAHNKQPHSIAQAIETLDASTVSEPDPGPAALSNRMKPTTRRQAGNKSTEPSAPTLADALAELDALIGLDPIKEEVRTLANFLQLNEKRVAVGLPGTEISYHMVFTGKPGTGKTSVARILGKVFGAMGLLASGHLVETDRTGLVAEYAGQTGPKANAKIDEALGGVLFIDEAYSLIAHTGEDPYGEEAVQALLKRAEDDRSQLIVILAGYPNQMQRLLISNPGLSSRFNRVLHFDDYTPLTLARIFGSLCNRDRYSLALGTRPKLMLGLTELYRRRDQHFGNGRAVRNLFEQSIRRMANRIAGLPSITSEQLVSLEEPDIQFRDLPPGWCGQYDGHDLKFKISCPDCDHANLAPPSFLGKKVRCLVCQHEFRAEWGEVANQCGPNCGG